MFKVVFDQKDEKLSNNYYYDGIRVTFVKSSCIRKIYR